MPFKPIEEAKKSAILKKVKEEGVSVPKVASEYGVSVKTVYAWLKNEGSKDGVPWVEFNRLKRENELLTKIIGELSVDIRKSKKKN